MVVLPAPEELHVAVIGQLLYAFLPKRFLLHRKIHTFIYIYILVNTQNIKMNTGTPYFLELHKKERYKVDWVG